MSVLVVTSKTDFPTDEVIKQLYERGEEVFRLNTEDICNGVDLELHIDSRNFCGSLSSQIRTVKLHEVQSVFYRRPQRPELLHLDEAVRVFIQSELSAFTNWLWEAMRDCFWVSKPSMIHIATSKIDQLRIAPHLGFTIPKTLITNNPEEVLKFYRECDGRIINKVLGQGTVNKDGALFGIYTHRVTEEQFEHIESIRDVPCVFQERIEKLFEVRVTVVGKKVFAAEIHSQVNSRTKDDWRRYDLENTPHKVHQLPKEIEDACIRLVVHYGLAFGAIDLIVTPEGQYVFLEINPNGQWLWIERLTGLPITKEIADLLINKQIK